MVNDDINLEISPDIEPDSELDPPGRIEPFNAREAAGAVGRMALLALALSIVAILLKWTDNPFIPSLWIALAITAASLPRRHHALWLYVRLVIVNVVIISLIGYGGVLLVVAGLILIDFLRRAK